ncbi:hypothetical protein C0Q70_19765 [Pomacea canaliculata]|uniref:NTF2 domain-containing protein n=2 Tax=Pomacea canaliculata TaxID=400727 RepID=A0A2T7NDN8_POMCA|nr:hypothetical protein C0Q70_19765 [Pomacea canaliculata]
MSAPASQRSTSGTASASYTFLETPTSQRSTSGTATDSYTFLETPTSQRSTSGTATDSYTFLATPTSQRSTSGTASASYTFLATPTSQRSTSGTASASYTFLETPTSQRSTSGTASASYTFLETPTSQRSTSGTATASNQTLQQTPERSSIYEDTKTTRTLKPIASHTRLASPASQRSTSGTTTTFNTHLATSTSRRSASETATVSTQPLQDTYPRRPFYEDRKNDRIAKRPASMTATVSITATISNQPLQETSPKISCYEYLQNQRIPKVTVSNTTCLATSDLQRQVSQTASVYNQRLQETSIRNFNEDHKSLVVSQCQPNPFKKGLGDFHKKTENEVMGESFVIWFYKLLNAENPAMNAVDEVDKFGPQHFWDNCTLRVVSRTESFSDETFTGSLLVSQRLKALVREEHLLFNPNVSKEGVHTVKSPFGIVMVMVCGTIHQHNTCLGSFEQAFGLVRESFQSNKWKIQVTHLHVESFHVTAVPKLRNSVEQDLLAIASEHALCLSRG